MADTDIKYPDISKLIVSSSPHLHQNQDARKIMLTVIIALLPACLMGIYYFGWRALWVLSVCMVASVAFEALFRRMRRLPLAIGDLSALLTGLLLGMNLSALTPWWVCVIGALLAIGLGKQLYGGLGYNIFNPALVGRVGLLVAFPKIMTTWMQPMPGGFLADAVTTATPLGEASMGVLQTDYWNYFVGNMPGCIGETSVLALLLGALLLIYTGYIRWQVPVAFIGTVLAISALVYWQRPETAPTPLFHLLTGGLMLGAFFMATDMVTSPMSKKGAWIFGLGCGIITAVIRIWGSFPEGVSFSILFMNALTPLIDRYTANTPFGFVKAKEPAA